MTTNYVVQFYLPSPASFFEIPVDDEDTAIEAVRLFAEVRNKIKPNEKGDVELVPDERMITVKSSSGTFVVDPTAFVCARYLDMAVNEEFQIANGKRANRIKRASEGVGQAGFMPSSGMN